MRSRKTWYERNPLLVIFMLRTYSLQLASFDAQSRARLRTSQSWSERSGMPSYLYLEFVVLPSLKEQPISTKVPRGHADQQVGYRNLDFNFRQVDPLVYLDGCFCVRLGRPERVS
ncbi:hypothetical protein EDD16DRAFT_1559254 [Pisolithus croceorrhizus]|nr:hypothetical protein EDD16DRAFT_1559254 [Pisolithus croceorrhizus]